MWHYPLVATPGVTGKHYSVRASSRWCSASLFKLSGKRERARLPVLNARLFWINSNQHLSLTLIVGCSQNDAYGADIHKWTRLVDWLITDSFVASVGNKGPIFSERLAVSILSVLSITLICIHCNLHGISKWLNLCQLVLAKTISDAILKWLDSCQLTTKSNSQKIVKNYRRRYSPSCL